MRRSWFGTISALALLLLSVAGYSQSFEDMAKLQHPLLLDISPDGSTLWYRVGQGTQLRDGVWEVPIDSDAAPRLEHCAHGTEG